MWTMLIDHDLDSFNPTVDDKLLTATLLCPDKNFIMWYSAKIVPTNTFCTSELVDKICLN